MHSIASVKSASGAAKYFAKDDFVSGEYYTDEKAGDVSMWGGEGAAAAGLTGAVAQDTFAKVLGGELPSGEKVDVREGRRPGFDLTFSAPKSVSVMAYIAGDKRILGPDGAQTKAVQQTMAWVEKNLAAGRITKDGRTETVKTGNLVYALFQHDTSRALDPQAHIHAIVANMTQMPDGKWQALDAQKLWASNTVIGSIYHSYLRDELEKLGYQVRMDGKHGTFEIVGVPRQVLEAFSQRREQIMEKAAELGIVSPKGRDGVTVNTRDPKLNVEDRDGLVLDWMKKAAEHGFDGKKLLEGALENVAQRENAGLVGRSYHAIADAVKVAMDTVSGLLRSPDPLVDRGFVRLAQSTGQANAQLAVASAVRSLDQREAAFDMDDNLRQQTDQLRTVAALANVGKAGQAMKVLGDKVVEHQEPSKHASELWLALSPAERAETAIFASGRATRATINEEVQRGLKAEGTLKGDGLYIAVIENVNVEREDLRYARTYEKGQRLEIKGRVSEVGLERGVAEVKRTLANGRVEIVQGGKTLRFNPQKIDPMIDQDRMSLATIETIQIHEGDRIRWTDNDKERGIYNASLATITGIEGRKVTVELANKDQVTLEHNDKMMQRMDLAYALNMHMAQGITVNKAITVMQSWERNLSNQRLFNVGVTRIRFDLTMVVDNQQTLEMQLDRNPGDKTSSLESLGRLDIDGAAVQTKAADDALTKAMESLDQAGSEKILIDPASLDMTDLPPMGASTTDYSDMRNIDGEMPSMKDRDDAAYTPDPYDRLAAEQGFKS